MAGKISDEDIEDISNKVASILDMVNALDDDEQVNVKAVLNRTMDEVQGVVMGRHTESKMVYLREQYQKECRELARNHGDLGAKTALVNKYKRLGLNIG